MRKLQIILTVIAATAGGALTQWLTAPTDARAQESREAVRTESFELTDGEGKVRLRMNVVDDAATLQMFDGDDQAVLALKVQEDGRASVDLSDTEGKPRAGLRTGADGAPVLSMNYGSGRIATLMTVQGDKDAVFIANDPEGETLAAFGNSSGRPRLLFADAKGRERAKLELKENHSPALTMKDAEGRSRLFAGVEGGGWSGFGAMDKSETVRAMLFSESVHGVTVAGEDGSARGMLTVNDEGDASLTTRDRNGNQTARVPR